MPLYPVRFAFSTGSSDRVEAVITAPKERRCILHGTVYDENGQRAPDAVVCLYLREEGRLTPAGNTFTDADGEFALGPLTADNDYLVKVYHGGALLREITVRPRKKRKPAQT
ncbi:MAG: carboxypeptidase regulatory-like domain-containing protein [Christensenellaceae bacterium]|nr:carboxypeptidase regulatory-like domain-containing protein [Christensenellaceae bacterium]